MGANCTKIYVPYLIILLLFAGTIIQAQERTQNLPDTKLPVNVNDIIKKISDHRSSRSNVLFNNNLCNRTGAPDAGNLAYPRDGFLLDTSIAYVSCMTPQITPAIAFDGTNYLVVWTDDRNMPGTDIYGARVSPAGVILDSVGIAISVTDYDNDYPAIAFDGTNYLVVWAENFYVGGTYYEKDIYGARISQSGTVLDPAHIAISTAVNSPQDYPVIAFDGTNYLVVWQDGRNDFVLFDIYGVRVSQSGTVLDAAGIPISQASDLQRYPAVAFDGTNYLIVWEDWRSYFCADIYGARVSLSGTVLDTSGIAISTANDDQYSPSVAANGSGYFTVWMDTRNSVLEGCEIYGARVSGLGILLDSNGIDISNDLQDQLAPCITVVDTFYLVAWEDDRDEDFFSDVYCARVTQSGIVLDPFGSAISVAPNWQQVPAVAFDGTNCLVVWEDHRSDVSMADIYGARVAHSGTVFDSAGIIISTTANYQDKPSIAFNNTNYLVAWQDNRHNNVQDICGVRVSPSSTILDTLPIAISSAGGNQVNPVTASDGTDYFVVWQDYRNSDSADIYGTRVTQSGAVLDPDGILISNVVNCQEEPSIAHDGTNYLVLWQDNRNGGYYDIYGARISASGAVLDPAGFQISNGAWHEGVPVLAFDGINYLVVWQDSRTGPSNWDVYGARVSQSGTVMDPTGIPISAGGATEGQPAIAFDGVNYFVLWQDGRSDINAIYGSKISQSGAVLNPNGVAISTNEFDQYLSAVVFDGVNYLVIGGNYYPDGETDVYGFLVDTLAVVLDTFLLVPISGGACAPALAHGAGNQMLIAYSDWADSINTHAVSTRRIWGDFFYSSGIEEETKGSLPLENLDLRVCPNPITNRQAKVEFTLPVTTNIELKAYDVTGRCCAALASGRFSAGIHNLNAEVNLPAGVYFYNLKTSLGSNAITKVLIIN